MKVYVFFYYDSIDNFNSDKKSEFVVTASRFPVAFEAFYRFVVDEGFRFFTFLNTYKVCSARRISYRVLPSKVYRVLDKLRRVSDD